MARLFGTDGVRGIANDTLTPELAYHLGRAAAYVLGQEKNIPHSLSAGIRVFPERCSKASWQQELPRQGETAILSV